MTTEWLKATGLALGLALSEVLCCTPGEIISLANANAIRHGAKQKHKIKTFDEFLALE